MILACRKHVVAATGSSPFKVRDNQRPERTMSGVRKPTPESSVPGENLDRGSRRNQLRRGHGSPPMLSEVPHELSTDAHSKECKRSPQQFIPAGFPLYDNFPRGRKTQTDSLTTPDMVRSGRVLQPQLNLHFILLLKADKFSGRNLFPLSFFLHQPRQLLFNIRTVLHIRQVKIPKAGIT